MSLPIMRILPRKPYPVVQRASPRVWRMFDARNQVVGRIASRIAFYLQGKYKPSWRNNTDDGDNIVVLNAEKIKFTGNKWTVKTYKHHTGWSGGLQEIPAKRMLERHPTKILYMAVYGMLPRNKLRMRRLRRLRVFSGVMHPHSPQFPGVVVEEDPPMLTDQEMFAQSHVVGGDGEEEQVYGTLFGMTYEEMLAKGYPTWRDMLPPKAVAKFDENVRLKKEEGIPKEFEQAVRETDEIIARRNPGEVEIWPMYGSHHQQPDGRKYKPESPRAGRKIKNQFEPAKPQEPEPESNA
eukprot:gb/GEZN01012742.1/.p1 GENE.gb/GEZN01012742.1/~~gb/GEZN01012742.1/.p1  ORF type:complete len:294 (+),score=39.03 gb/GEZN01012742.1/:122-1003(+)